MKNEEKQVGVILADEKNRILLCRNESGILVLPETKTDWKDSDTKCSALRVLKENLHIPIPDCETYDSRILNLHEFSEGPYKLEREGLIVWIFRLSVPCLQSIFTSKSREEWISGLTEGEKYGPDVRYYIEKYYKIFPDPKKPVNLGIDRTITPGKNLDCQEERQRILKELRERLVELTIERYETELDDHPVRQKRNKLELQAIENEIVWRMQDYEALMYDQKKDWDLNFDDYGFSEEEGDKEEY